MTSDAGSGTASGRAKSGGGVDFRARPEHRWPVVAAIAVELVLYAVLPDGFSPVIRVVVIGISLVLLVPLVAYNPRRLNRETAMTRRLSMIGAAVLLVGNNVALVELVHQLVTASQKDAGVVLLAAAQVWVTLVIGYSVVYWELDRGGPVARRREPRDRLQPADFRFPQDEDRDAVSEVARRSSDGADWSPSYFDYLYVSATDAMAFSPTDAMPLSIRAKALMLAESLSGYVVFALVVARSVNMLG